jgi:hypothetical protein
VQVDLAIDDNGQSLSGVAQGSADFGNPLMEQRLALRGRALRPAYGYFPGVMFEPFRAFLQVERGPKASKKLADLRGKLVVAVQVPPEELAVVSDLKEPKGEQVKGEKGVDLRVTRCKTVGNNVEVDAELRYPHQEVQPAGTAPAVPGEPAVNRFMGLALFDEKGKEYTFQYCRQQEVSQNGTTMTFKVQMNYTRTRKDQPAPARMAFLATRTATADIPFSFKDVPLP